jgi:hypothetical protein
MTNALAQIKVVSPAILVQPIAVFLASSTSHHHPQSFLLKGEGLAKL